MIKPVGSTAQHISGMSLHTASNNVVDMLYM